MRDFTWNYFSITGDVDAYLLYKEMNSEKFEEEDLDDDSLETWDEE
jgi:hypothetical protein